MIARLRQAGMALLLMVCPSTAHAQFTTTSDGNGGLVVTAYTGSGTAVSIPGTISGLPVTTIGNTSVNGLGAFQNKYSLVSVSIPNSVTSIGNHAFSGCVSLAGVTIPGSVTSIGGAAFQDCQGLTSVTIPANVTSIGFDAFAYCSGLTSVIFTGNAPTMGVGAFLYTPSGLKVYYLDASGFTSPNWTDSSGDIYPAINLDPFSGTALSGGWYYSPWFGTYNPTYFPWVNNASLGFIYVSSSDPTNLYLYVFNGNSGSMGWLYTTQAQFPNVYSFSKGTWLSYGGGTSFYNYNTASWETY